MGFVNGLSLPVQRPSNGLLNKSAFTNNTSFTIKAPCKKASSLRMATGDTSYDVTFTRTKRGYGDYNYTSDKTAGQIGNYYRQIFRDKSQIAKKQTFGSDASYLGRDERGRIQVPKEGIPQPVDDILKLDAGVERMEDPRVKEAEGVLYPWDAGYEDTSFTEGLADYNDETQGDEAFASFRGMMSEDRGKRLSQLDRSLNLELEEIDGGYDEGFLLTSSGQWKMEQARLSKLKNTDLPESIGVFDFMGKKGKVPVVAEIVGKEEKLNGFWKQEMPKDRRELPEYVKPPGANVPELPYNAAPDVSTLLERSKARGLPTAAE